MLHYNDVIMTAMASRITSRTIVYSSVYSGIDQRKHQSSASLAFVGVIYRWPVNAQHIWIWIWTDDQQILMSDSAHKGSVTRKMCPFDDVIMTPYILHSEFVLTRQPNLRTISFRFSIFHHYHVLNVHIHKSKACAFDEWEMNELYLFPRRN